MEGNNFHLTTKDDNGTERVNSPDKYLHFSELMNARIHLAILSTKVGLVLLVLGGMHFFNLYVFSKLRRRGLQSRNVPPVLPQTQMKPVS